MKKITKKTIACWVKELFKENENEVYGVDINQMLNNNMDMGFEALELTCCESETSLIYTHFDCETYVLYSVFSSLKKEYRNGDYVFYKDSIREIIDDIYKAYTDLYNFKTNK